MAMAKEYPVRLALACVLASLAGGCGSTRLWPFGEPETGRAVVPENAVQYRCAGNRGFWLRMLPGGDAWVILPEREFRLDKAGGNPRRFSAGVTILDLGGDAAAEASLSDGTPQGMNGCRPAERAAR
jgi:hypothetical protein